MTLNELKADKYFSSLIKDNELIQLCNEILKPEKEIKTMDFKLEGDNLDKVRYSKQMIDFIISKTLANKEFSMERKYNSCIRYLTDSIKVIGNKSNLSEERKYLTQMLERMNKEKTYYQTMESMIGKNMSVLIDVSPNNLTKLNKEALAVYSANLAANQNDMISTMRAMYEEIKKLNEKVEELRAGKVSEVPLEAPEKPNIIPEVQEEQVVQSAPNGPVVKPLNGMPPLYPKGSLHDLITSKAIPDIDEQQLIDYCNNVLGFNAKDGKFVPSAIQLDKLMNSAFVSSGKIRSDIRSQHMNVADKYSELISSYESMINEMKGKPGFESDVAALEGLVAKISSKKNEYISVVKGFELGDMEQYFQFGSSKLGKAMSEIASEQQKQLSEIDENLSQLIDRKSSLEKANYKNIFAKIKNTRDLKKITNKINRLKNKQGMIKSNQKKIVDLYTNEYVKRMERQFDKFLQEQERIQLDVSKKENSLVDLNERQAKLERISRKLVSIENKRKNANQVTQVMLDTEKKIYDSKHEKLRAKVEALQAKVGSVDLSKQYSTTFQREFGYAL